MSENRNHIDLTILICVLALMLLSIGIVYSASATISADKTGSSESFLTNHAIKVFLGIICIFVFMRLDYHRLQRLTKMVLVILILLLFATTVAGFVVKGAQRWLRFGFIGFQPSELAKYALLFHLSALIVKKGELVQDFKRGYIPMLTWVGMVTFLVMVQPNFSMSMLIFSLGLMMLYIGNVRVTDPGIFYKNNRLGVLFVLPILGADNAQDPGAVVGGVELPFAFGGLVA